MIHAKIDITGPGLVVNGPALLIIEALKEIGFNVKYEEWAGLKQWNEVDLQKIKERIRTYVPKDEVEIVVHPMPWGG